MKVYDESSSLKDVQECGDFINYDFPKEYKQNILAIEGELKEELSNKLKIGRIRQRYPEAPRTMTSSEIEVWNKKMEM